MSKIWRRNLFTDEYEWVDVDTSNFVKVASRDERKEYSTLYCQPEVSTAAGCHSSQVEDFNNFYRERGITGAYHRPDGACVFESNHARNQVLKARGMYDRDASYGQWAGNESD